MIAPNLRYSVIAAILLHTALIFVAIKILPPAQTPRRVMETFIIASPAVSFEEGKRSIPPHAETVHPPRVQKIAPQPPLPPRKNPRSLRTVQNIKTTEAPPNNPPELKTVPSAASQTPAAAVLTAAASSVLPSSPQEKDPESQSSSSSRQSAATGQVLVLGEDGAPRFIQRELPIYPYLARKFGKEGTVVLKLALDSQGQLQGIEIVEANGFGFAEAARTAVTKSTFAPAIRDGNAIPSQVLVSVRFVLHKG